MSNNGGYQWHHQSAELYLTDYKYAFVPFLFNEALHLAHQRQDSTLYSFCLTDERQKKIVATWSGCAIGDTFYSPLRASFGGLQMSADVAASALRAFYEQSEAYLRAQAIRRLCIRQAPSIYHPEADALITQLLLCEGFRITQQDLNYHLTPHTTIHKMEQRKIRKCQEAGFEFGSLQGLSPVAIYDYVAAARARKGYPMSLSRTQFTDLMHQFPQHFLTFGITHHTRTIALAVCVHICPQILYYFYPAADADYQRYSPSAYLIDCLARYAFGQGYEILDLGIATEASQPNESLIAFKKHMGGIVGLKLSFEKTL